MFNKTFTLLISLFKNYDFDLHFSFLLKPKNKNDALLSLCRVGLIV